MEPQVTQERDDSIFALLHEDHYTPEELARILDMDVRRVEQAAYRGNLRAVIADHEIICITRAAAIEWAQNGY